MNCRILLLATLLTASCEKATTTTPTPEELREQRFGEHGQYLRGSDRLELYSIASTGPSRYPTEVATNEEFHGFKIYGKTWTDDRREIEAIWSELHDCIYSEPATSYTYCFWPRHAIRAFSGGDIRDYLICFECDHLYIYPDPNNDEYERIGLESVEGTLKLNDLLDSAKTPREQPKSNKSEEADAG